MVEEIAAPGTTDPERHASHLDLLRIASSVRRRSVLGDTEGLHAELARLRTELVLHLHAEQDQLARVRGASGTVAREGQRRLVALLDELLTDSSGDGADCNCLLRAAEIEVALGRQARLEQAVLGRHPSQLD